MALCGALVALREAVVIDSDVFPSCLVARSRIPGGYQRK